MPNKSCWDEGAKAAREHIAPDFCPYDPTDYNFVAWMNGWVYTYHLMCKEAQESTSCSPK